MAEVDAVLAEVEAAAGQRRTNAIALTIVALAREKICQHATKPDGILMALAENPHLLDPVREFERRMAERIRRTAVDCELSLITLLVIEGMRSLELFAANPLSSEECATVLDRLVALLDRGADDTDNGGTA